MKQICDHTALPWEIRDNTKLPYGRNYYIHNGNAKEVVLSMDRKNDADFILTACNNFYKMKDKIIKLIKIAKELLSAFPCDHDTGCCCCHEIAIIEGAEKLIKELEKCKQ